MSLLQRYRPARAIKPAYTLCPRLEVLEDCCMPATFVVANLSGSGAATSDDVSGTITQTQGDLFGTTPTIAIGGDLGNNQFDKNPLLGPLQYNGSPIATVALPPGSLAIGTGAGTNLIAGLSVSATDQRGDLRPANSIDIGAFQAPSPASPSSPTPSSLPTSVSLTQVHLASSLSGEAVSVTAQVSSPGGPVNEGTVTFSVAGHMAVAPVNVNGLATAQVGLPALTTSMPLTIGATYSDSGAVFGPSASSGMARFLAVDALMPRTMNASADGGETITDLPFDVMSLSRSYDALGRLTEVNFDGIPLETYSYNAQGQLAAIGMLAVQVPLPFGLPPQLADVLFQDGLDLSLAV